MVARAGEIAAEHRDLQKVSFERSAKDARSATCRIDAVECFYLGRGKDSLRSRIRLSARGHGDPKDAPADDSDEGEQLHQPLGSLQSRVLGANPERSIMTAIHPDVATSLTRASLRSGSGHSDAQLNSQLAAHLGSAASREDRLQKSCHGCGPQTGGNNAYDA